MNGPKNEPKVLTEQEKRDAEEERKQQERATQTKQPQPKAGNSAETRTEGRW